MTMRLRRLRMISAVLLVAFALFVLAGSPTAVIDHPVVTMAADPLDVVAELSEFDEAVPADAGIAAVFAAPLSVLAVVLCVAPALLTVRDRGPPRVFMTAPAVNAR